MIPPRHEIDRVIAQTGMGELQAIRHLQGRALVRSIAPRGMKHRISSDSAWPLRGADGRTFAQRKAQQAQAGNEEIGQ